MTHGLSTDPAPREIRYTIVSVDDHLVEPPHLFEGRVPKSLADRAPKVIETDAGSHAWVFDGERYELPCLGAVVGRPREEWGL